MEKIKFMPDGEEPVEFYVLEQTTLGGFQYILVTDSEDGDGEALILKDVSEADEADGIYTIVSDDDELGAVASVFQSLLDDVEIV